MINSTLYFFVASSAVADAPSDERIAASITNRWKIGEVFISRSLFPGGCKIDAGGGLRIRLTSHGFSSRRIFKRTHLASDIRQIDSLCYPVMEQSAGALAIHLSRTGVIQILIHTDLVSR